MTDRNLGSLDFAGFPRFVYLPKFHLRSILSLKEAEMTGLCGKRRIILSFLWKIFCWKKAGNLIAYRLLDGIM